MKRLLGLLVLIVLLNGCDDGKLTVDIINFEDVTASPCGEIIYKLKDSEALFMNIPASENAFVNDETLEGKPREILIEGEVTVKYRSYNGKVSKDNICEIAGPITPAATSEWIAKSGTIQVTTKANYSATNAETGQKKISGYSHFIVYKNIVFSKSDGNEQKYDIFTFGDYQIPATSLPFSFTSIPLQRCSSTTKIFSARNTGNESLVLENVDSNLIQNNTGTITQPITATSNKLVYRLYESSLPTTALQLDYFCGNTTPVLPVIKEEWVATSGDIEVSTTTSGGILHTIRLKNVTFKRGNSSFYYGDDMLYGELLLPE